MQLDARFTISESLRVFHTFSRLCSSFVGCMLCHCLSHAFLLSLLIFPILANILSIDRILDALFLCPVLCFTIRVLRRCVLFEVTTNLAVRVDEYVQAAVCLINLRLDHVRTTPMFVCC